MSSKRSISDCKKVRMSLGQRSYDIRIGSGAVRGLPRWLTRRPSKRGFLISDEKLVQARKAVRASLLSAGWELHEIVVPAGESLKEIDAIYPIYGELLKTKANRDSVLFALGGGSIGDAAGFVAATYLRGISWVGIPTTLLAQVDSSVGGKTGINHSTGKNLIGAFHQPELVVCDTDFLETLSRREVVSGLGEAVKYGIVYDPSFYSFLKKHSSEFLELEPEVLSKSVQKSLQWKCKAVSKDEFDRKGIREVLNFGHTFGHALESVTGYELYQHGEAVIWGMRFALALSEVRKHLPAKERREIDSFLSQLAVPPIPKRFGAPEFFAHMSRDKKVRNGKIHFVLLKKLGRTVSDNGVRKQDLMAAYRLLGLDSGTEKRESHEK